MRFSPSTLGWYPESIEYPNLPSDVVTVSEDLYESLRGKQIEASPEGRPREAPAIPPDPVPSLVSGLQALMDAQAKALGYDDLKTAITYRGDPNPKFAAEAEGFFVYRSGVWTTAYAYLARVKAGEVPFPTLDEAIAMMPALNITYPS
ncbi:hypothetical protein [Variovorax paradoxus]|uniref:hypothetical protein n=1 Tax=Variovorax paradoxus TaxID=34073 RepID=UPI002860A9E3|nr:hypothetical protein [Variovorax paradoxus]MDR6455488.1 hypothetical protein [Variovorax paradoxus]